jgi:hypothetical protein
LLRITHPEIEIPVQHPVPVQEEQARIERRDQLRRSAIAGLCAGPGGRLG